ncbi:succinate dehydrogenase subunit 3-2, mitochondrial-like [Phalaenopsis equestris]|uniref:succinate dehydrogenase subunit 3-2, mitochondrial-like n=1 Tax=Phalaenopsis equestris TaxID=78828 RepID=UPI0009E48B3D|nr:succinate dehydrogenase subunit 3-2, mitochondrial-like [Phalaenopsis equestris]XP_020573949.1 succinate dehydrogenase subunit 3-2, mitochondrial-like [Phalaenopsis equestris]
MDTSFALRGLIGSSRTSDNNAVRRLPSNIELPTEERLAKRSLTGSRAFHGSRIISESAKGAYLNRPLSPHLPLKKPQLSATYSISHRIFGVGVASAILLVPLAMKFSTLFDI